MQEDTLLFLIQTLLAENPQYRDVRIPAEPAERFRLYRSLVNLREPKPVSHAYLEAEDAFLSAYTAQKGITDAATLMPANGNLYLWQGDITTLKCDAIVNAANAQMLGCFSPCHGCIDNAIHTFAGVRLRLKCAEIMRAQGAPEPTGSAKITPAYNLPSRYVLHTVGPIVDGALTARHRAQLASSYRHCLELAAQNGVKSIAFCCISTGVFGFPQHKAAEIAVSTVKDYKKTTSNDIKVIFNVFKDDDLMIYRNLLSC